MTNTPFHGKKATFDCPIIPTCPILESNLPFSEKLHRRLSPLVLCTPYNGIRRVHEAYIISKLIKRAHPSTACQRKQLHCSLWKGSTRCCITEHLTMANTIEKITRNLGSMAMALCCDLVFTVPEFGKIFVDSNSWKVGKVSRLQRVNDV